MADRPFFRCDSPQFQPMMTRSEFRYSAVGLAMILAGAVGCAGKSYKVDHPVVGPAPPRLSPEMIAKNDGREDEGSLDDTDELDSSVVKPVAGRLKSKVKTASFAPLTDFESVPDKGELPGAIVVARVNGHPILASEILQRHAPEIEGAREQAQQLSIQGDKPGAVGVRNEIRKKEEELVREELPWLVDQYLRAEAVKVRLKKEQIEKIDGQLNEMFEDFAKNMQAKLKCNSNIELEARLQTMGTSLESLQRNFREQGFADQYLKAKTQSVEKQTIERQELLRAYHDRIAQYTSPAEVKWQEVQIIFRKHKSPEEALRVLDHALLALNNGTPFDAVVAEFSDAPNAKQGGNEDWKQIDSLANKDLVEILSSLPVNREFATLNTDRAHRIIRVTGRKASTQTPFEDVQDKLRQTLMVEHKKVAEEKAMVELRKSAIIDLHPTFSDLAGEFKQQANEIR